MDLKKLATIIGILAVTIPAGWSTFSFVSETQAFQERVERRFLQDDITALRKRLWDLEREFPQGRMPPSVVEEHIRLKAELDMMMEQLRGQK